MSLEHAPPGFGWFAYGRNPNGMAGQWHVPRAPDDPPIVVWRVDETMFIIDDDIADRQVRVGGLTESEVVSALYFAQAMNWIPPNTEYVVKQVRSTD
jgi:hypothetical protein